MPAKKKAPKDSARKSASVCSEWNTQLAGARTKTSQPSRVRGTRPLGSPGRRAARAMTNAAPKKQASEKRKPTHSTVDTRTSADSPRTASGYAG